MRGNSFWVASVTSGAVGQLVPAQALAGEGRARLYIHLCFQKTSSRCSTLLVVGLPHKTVVASLSYS